MIFPRRAALAALIFLSAPAGAAESFDARVASDASAPRLERTRAIEALAKARDRRAIPVLTALLTGGETDADVRAEAARRIRSFAPFQGRDGVDLLGPLFQVIHSDPSGYVRSISTDTIRGIASGSRSKRATVDRMIAELGDPSSLGRENAALILGDLGDRRAVPALVAALDTPSDSRDGENSRAYAARSLARLVASYRPGDAEAVPALMRVLTGERSRLVRSYAGQALAELGEHGSRLAIDSLVGAFSGAGQEVQEDIVQALGEIGDATGLPVILDAAADRQASWDLRITTIHALGKFPKSARVVPALVGFLSDREEVIRGAALEALEDVLGESWSELPAARRLEALLAVADFLGDPRSAVRGQAAQILRDRLLQLARSDARVRETLERCFPEAPGRGLSAPGGAITYMVDMVLFFGFPAFTNSADRHLSANRVVPPENPWPADDIARIRSIIRGLIQVQTEAEIPAA